ncbi:MAG TPA: hypothetical protein ENN24_05455 [Bacteroidetes bacterium]|nr:hypothetical protein [Bacteroidota bacterium]
MKNILLLNSVLLFVFTVVISVSPSAQPRNFTTDNRKAIAKFEKSLKAYDKFSYGDAEKLLVEALKFDKNFIEAQLMLAQVYQVTRQTEEAIVAAERAIEINPTFFPHVYYNVANMLIGRGEYERAQKHYESFLTFDNVREETRKHAELKLAKCKFALKAIANPVPLAPESLGTNVNSNMDDYWPSLSADENTLVITVNIPKDPSLDDVFRNRQEDLFITTRNEQGEWEPVRNIGPPINTPQFNEGAQSITSDGNTMYYTVCDGRCNLYVSSRQDNGLWGRPKKLPEPVNLNYSSEKQPSISPDGSTLYFVSDRKGGFGSFDIWRSHRVNENQWTEPENLGDSVNTEYLEQSPFIHFDNQTLYFSSNGHVGMGGLDIFMTRMINDTTWAKPENLGYPINTHMNEDGLIVNAKGTKAYYSSEINPESGRDIYQFDLPANVRPIPSSYVSGTITDAKTGWPLQALLSLVDVDKNQTVMESQSATDGSFLVCIPTNRQYAFFVTAPGYLFHSHSFNLKGIHSAANPFKKDVELTPIRAGEKMVMRNIFFETDSYDLKPQSIVELQKLLELLRLNPTLKIEVGGHTDSVGTASYNLVLSENRAKAVAQYLIENGVDQSRISSKGYGLTKPIGDNQTDVGRALNRRTEIRVLDI